jgi:hypothetical protein
MESIPAFYLIIAYMIYIIGLTLPSLFLIFKDRWKELSSPKYKLLRSKNFKISLFLKNIKLLPRNPYEQLSQACAITGIGSIFLSVFIMLFYAWEPYALNALYYIGLSLFVGLWAPNLLIIAIFIKIFKKLD